MHHSRPRQPYTTNKPCQLNLAMMAGADAYDRMVPLVAPVRRHMKRQLVSAGTQLICTWMQLCRSNSRSRMQKFYLVMIGLWDVA